MTPPKLPEGWEWDPVMRQYQRRHVGDWLIVVQMWLWWTGFWSDEGSDVKILWRWTARAAMQALNDKYPIGDTNEK